MIRGVGGGGVGARRFSELVLFLQRLRLTSRFKEFYFSHADMKNAFWRVWTLL